MPEANEAVEHLQFFFQRGDKGRQTGRQFRNTGNDQRDYKPDKQGYAKYDQQRDDRTRGTRRASSLRAKGDNMTPTTKAATIGSINSRAR